MQQKAQRQLKPADPPVSLREQVYLTIKQGDRAEPEAAMRAYRIVAQSHHAYDLTTGGL